MPDLEISKTWTDSFFVYATMAHPCNERYRNEYVAALMMDTMSQVAPDIEDSEIEIPSSIAKVLLNAPSYEDIKERASKSNARGAVAGDLLEYVAQMCLTKHKQPSVRKAVYVAEEYLSNAIDGFGKKGGSSDIFIYDCWSEYKTVAHLWAAFRLRQFAHQQPENNGLFDLENPLLEGEFDKFLAVAESFRFFGEGFVSATGKSRESILSKDETWKVPENYTLPSVYLSLNGMPDWMAERLKGYSKRNV